MNDQNAAIIQEPQSVRPREEGWLKIKPLLPPYRPSGSNEVKLKANELALERERVKLASVLITHLQKKGYTIHPNTSPGLEDIFGLDFPYEAKRIAFPKHIMTADPNEDISGKQLFLRRDIPILYTLSGFAHEAAHLDRYASDPKVARVMDKMLEDRYLTKSQQLHLGIDGKIISETLEEETVVDTEGFFLLKKLGMNIEPENYCTYVGRGNEYEQIVYERIKKRLGI